MREKREFSQGEQPDVIKRLAEEAIEFLEERDLVTIPPLAKGERRAVNSCCRKRLT